MAIQGINLPGVGTSSLSLPANNLSQKADKNQNHPSINNRGSRMNAILSTESYSSQKYALEYTSKDGDKVSFSFESIQYSRSDLAISAEGDAKDIDKLAKYVQDQYAKLREAIVKGLMKDAGFETNGVVSSDELDPAKELNIPEYWNAQNTSQRIVDFATSFFDAFKGEGNEFLETIKNAIKDGFKQAMDIWEGALSEPATKLVNNTFDLTMKKLDKWAEEKGIVVTDAQIA
jgi:hypothetical protein